MVQLWSSCPGPSDVLVLLGCTACAAAVRAVLLSQLDRKVDKWAALPLTWVMGLSCCEHRTPDAQQDAQILICLLAVLIISARLSVPRADTARQQHAQATWKQHACQEAAMSSSTLCCKAWAGAAEPTWRAKVEDDGRFTLALECARTEK